MARKNKEKIQLRHLKAIVYLVAVITVAMVIEIFILSSFNKKNSNRTSEVLLNQVVNIIEDNEKNENELIESLKEDYIIRAQTVSYILDAKPEAEYDIEELQKIADMMHIDEIHLFDDSGKIYSGSEPKYYGYNFDSGEQMAYFKPMLEDKTLTMCQDVTPNTAEGKSMMYAITWNESGDKMIQIGIEPLRLLEELRSNEISEVIANMPAYEGISIWVADADTGVICGSTDDSMIGSTLEETGISQTVTESDTTISDVVKIGKYRNYYNLKKAGEYIVVVANSISSSIKNVFAAMVIELVYLIVAGAIIIYVTHNIDKQKQKEKELLIKSNVDELTGLYNRRAYEDDIAAHNDAATEDNFVFVSLDVNGLKKVNDSLGHVAGDELLVGAANCMKQCFGPYGKIYRTGGDEFAAIIYVNENQLQSIKRNFEVVTSKWAGCLVDGFSVSCGYVTKHEVDTSSVHEIANIADRRMYEEKSAFYTKCCH